MIRQMAWRNIWRNPKRTLVITAAVSTGLWSLVVLTALSVGIMESMVANGVASMNAHLQIQRNGFQEDPVIEHCMSQGQAMVADLATLLPEGSVVSPRLRLNCVANNAHFSRGITMVGMLPNQERKVSFIGHAPIEGRFLNEDDHNKIVIGQALAEKMNTQVGRKLILMTRRSDGEIGSRSFKIVGLFRAEIEANELAYAFVPLNAARQMVGLSEQALTEIAILLPDRDAAAQLAPLIAAKLNAETSQLKVLTWQEMMPFIQAYLAIYDNFMYLWYLVVFVAMGFGIVNTTLMAVMERVREFGLFKALGMRPGWIVRLVLVESAFTLLLGTLIGNLIGLFTVFVLLRGGIDLSALSQGSNFIGVSRIITPQLKLHYFLVANMVVFLLGNFVCLYPAVKASRYTPVEAMSQQN